MSIRVAPCRQDEVSLIEQREPPGVRLARHYFASQQRGDSTYLVAWVDGVPAGTGELALSGRIELRNLHVDEEFRGRGVGSAIIAAAESVVGTGMLSVGVGLANHAARRLYERLGFVASGELETTTYSYFDAEGVSQTATETDEYLTKRLEGRRD